MFSLAHGISPYECNLNYYYEIPFPTEALQKEFVKKVLSHLKNSSHSSFTIPQVLFIKLVALLPSKFLY
jgi:hypothetical protein